MFLYAPVRNRTVILDAFCGCGGNAIGFAKLERSHAELIICVDIDRSKLKMAANNASIYGIEKDRIIFIESDSTFILQQCRFFLDCILFLDQLIHDGHDVMSANRMTVIRLSYHYN